MLILAPVYLYVFYVLLTKLTNSSYILVDKETISVKHKPLPILPGISISADSVLDIRIERKESKGKSRKMFSHIYALTNSGKKQLIGEIESEFEAEYIKAEILKAFQSKT